MTAPGSSRPQGAFTISSSFGQDYDEDSVYEEITGQTRRDLGAAVGGFDECKLGMYNTAPDLANLQDRTQRLEGVVGYAYSYSSRGLHTGNQALFIPCDQPIGPSVGVNVADTRFTRNSRGLWVANGQLGFEAGGGLVQNIYVNVQIRVYAPDGSLFAHRISESTVSSAHTRTVQIPFVVPSAGYRCEMGLSRPDPRDQRRLGLDRVVSAEDQHRDRAAGFVHPKQEWLRGGMKPLGATLRAHGPL